MTVKHWILAAAVGVLTGCGGGGDSGPINETNNPSGGGGGGSGGGNTGGGSGGSATARPGGLVSGGVWLFYDPNFSGVSFDVAVGGTGLIMGDIQAFGSIIANDIVSDTDDAQFIVEGAAGSQANLSQGQQVLIVGDPVSGTAATVLYRSNVKGPITSAVVDPVLAQGSLVVLGQNVTIDAATTFSDTSLLGLTVGDLLEVSGIVEANGDIKATFVELETSLAEYKVTGRVAGVTATEFILGGLTVDYTGATLADFDTGAIADGDVVEAKGDPADFNAAAGTLEASRVERLTILTVGGDAVGRVEGFIDRFASAADFDVQTTPVTTDTNTVYVNGTSASLGLNVKVQIEGVADGEGGIVADTVTIQPTEAIRAEGDVEAIDKDAQTVTVLGVTFAARDLTRFEDNSDLGTEPLTLDDLFVGDEVEIRGYLDGANVIAAELEREDAEERARLRGPVTAEDAGAGTVDILDVRIVGQDGITRFENANGTPVSQSEFHDSVELGDFIRARWDVYSATTEVADQLSIED